MAITLLVSLGVGAIVIAAIGLVMYMSQLVKSAFALKVEMQSELETGLRRMDEEADKKIKWIRRDLVEEITRSKDALVTDGARRMQEFQDSLNKRMLQSEDMGRRDRVELVAMIEAQKRLIAELDQKLRAIQEERRRAALPTFADVAAVSDASADASTPTAAPAEVAAEPASATA